MIYFLIFIAIILGCLMPIQAGINAELSRMLNHPYLGAFTSFFIGTVALGLLILTKGIPAQEIKRVTAISPHLFLGGFLGALFVGSSIFLIPKMGATTMIATFVTGQLVGSVIIDHYGLMGLPINQINSARIIGVFLLFAGLLLVVRKGT